MIGKYRPPGKGKASKKPPGWHAHGCIRCHRTVWHGLPRCHDPEEDVVCRWCRGGREAFDVGQYLPRRCCLAESVPVTNRAELDRVGLAGTGPWFRCRSCGRSFAHHPPKEHP